MFASMLSVFFDAWALKIARALTEMHVYRHHAFSKPGEPDVHTHMHILPQTLNERNPT